MNRELTQDQIKHMVDRFLGWKLPEAFCPDAGISFKPLRNEGTQYEAKQEPVGTNLFSAEQAEAMIRYISSGIPLSALDAQGGDAVGWFAYSPSQSGDNDWVLMGITQEIAERRRKRLVSFGSTYSSVTPLYTHPSPTAVQALREARKFVAIHEHRRTDAASLLLRIDAILKEQPPAIEAPA